MEKEWQRSIEMYKEIQGEYKKIYDDWCKGQKPDFEYANDLVRRINKNSKYICVIEHRQELREMGLFLSTLRWNDDKKLDWVNIDSLAQKYPITGLKQIENEELKTKYKSLVNLLHNVELEYPDDNDSLLKIINELNLEGYKAKNPLFADLAEEQVEPIKELDGIMAYVGLALQASKISNKMNEIIGNYLDNPIIQNAIQGNSIEKQLQNDLKKKK